MKILYAVQATGNGHLSRAIEIIPHLKKLGKTDILVSGIQADIELPFEVKYKFKGLSFVFGKKGGIDYMKTYLKSNTFRLMKEIRQLPIDNYDLVINDFEPVSAWATHIKKLPCVALSNQCATLSPRVPQPKDKDPLGMFVLKHYAPSTAQYGFQFQNFAQNIFTPVIRKQIRQLDVTDKEHYTVYLPAYDDERLIKNLTRFKDVKWEVFSKHNKNASKHKNVHIQPINQVAFLKSIASCSGTLCAAGFGATSEALYLKKKLLIIPMKSQYEQLCNATVLKIMGVPIMKSLKKKHAHHIDNWLANGKVVEVNYPDITADILNQIVNEQINKRPVTFTD
ncbi:MAG: glycosyltransferase family protein [Bacteroidia bacterium]